MLGIYCEVLQSLPSSIYLGSAVCYALKEVGLVEGFQDVKGHVSHMLVGASRLHLCFSLAISPENCEHCSESFTKPNKFLSF